MDIWQHDVINSAYPLKPSCSKYTEPLSSQIHSQNYAIAIWSIVYLSNC